MDATLSPFFHIPLDPGGLTILVCVVNDVLNRDGGMSWLSRGTSRARPAYNIIGEEDNTENAVSVQSLVSTELDTYTCFVSHRSTIRFMHRNYGGFPRKQIGKSLLITHNPDLRVTLHCKLYAFSLL